MNATSLLLRYERGSWERLLVRVHQSWADFKWRRRLHQEVGYRRPCRPMHVVTGADAKYFDQVWNLLRDLRSSVHATSVSVWDLGLTESQRQALHDEYKFAAVTSFPFSDFPEFLRLEENAGQYAWKPVILESEVRSRDEGIVLWLDAGIRLTGNLELIRLVAEKRGFYSPYSAGTIGLWTHPTTLKVMGVNSSTLDMKPISAGVVAVDCGRQDVVNLIRRWKDWSLRREVIAPPGSDRGNHRQDQSILSIVVAESGIVTFDDIPELRRPLGLHLHTNRPGDSR